MSRGRTFAGLLVMALVAGCGGGSSEVTGDPSSDGLPDASTGDGSLADGTAEDGTAEDGTAEDGTAPDGDATADTDHGPDDAPGPDAETDADPPPDGDTDGDTDAADDAGIDATTDTGAEPDTDHGDDAPGPDAEDDAPDAAEADTGATDAASDTSADAGPACAPITGTSPFGVSLSGTVTFDDPGEPPRSIEALLFFPNGRVAGAPVILARPRTMAAGWDLANGTLGADLGVASLTVTDPHCSDSIDATLLGPTDGVLARVDVDVTAPSDAIVLKPGTAKLCATGAVDTPKLTSPHTVGMRDPIDLVVNLPVDPATLAGVTLGGGSVPITASIVGDRVRLSPTGAYAPSATMEVGLGGLADPLGRAFPAPSKNVLAWAPAGSLPEGTIGFALDVLAGFGASHAIIGGELRVIPDGGVQRYGIAIGLDSRSGTTKIRVRHRFVCTSFAGTMHASILGSSGEVTPLTAGCSETPVEEVVTLPGTGKRFLWVEGTAPANPPCSLPSPSTLPVWALASYTLEP